MLRIVPMDVPPYGLSGVVYGALLNHRTALEALGDAVDRPPYKGAPQAPVLYIKPRNTLAAGGGTVAVPPGVEELEVGATLGLVLGRTACRLEEANATEHLAGYLIVNDVSIPHLPYYRPSIRAKAQDGFCPLGPRVTARATVADPDALTIRVYVDGELKHTATTAELLRPVAKLLAEVTDFMTLSPGDVLAVGVAAPAPRVRAGQRVRIAIDGLGALESLFVADAR
ncbi:MAG: fumarylacetoacetate hydrolase family protein [Gammaproteobacteria bacterium]|nr:fumarylacetoacetate hydrolase family protein [Gammaproteobacteria bacterium]